MVPFGLEDNIAGGARTGANDNIDKYDIVLFCHSLYGMKHKHNVIKRALEMLVEQPQGGMVVVFHRDRSLDLGDLVCHRTASFPTGVVRVADDDEVLDCFTPFIAGSVMQDVKVDKAVRAGWREVCRTLGSRDEARPNHLAFSSPNVMLAFTQHATTLPELMAQLPLPKEERTVKNWEARLHRPAAVIKPTEVRHIQQCVLWALKHGVSLTVVGGGHSGHCLWSNVVSIDMGGFDQVHILTAGEDEEDGEAFDPESGPLVVAEGGCMTGDIVRKAMAAGVVVPLGARPSVGAGLWLQGGIGHLARLHGLACDAIVGAVVVGVDSGQVFYVGRVPSQHRPAGAVRPDNEADLLWALKGAGSNFGIVVSVTFKTYTAPTYRVRSCLAPLNDGLEARVKLSEFDKLIAGKLSRDCSADAYLYWEGGQLHLGVAMIESSKAGFTGAPPTRTSAGEIWGLGDDVKVVDGVGLFEAEMYMSGMHGGHGGGKTFSFKRCVFLKGIRQTNVADRLVKAVETCPSPLCYLHLLQGGGAVADVAADATGFGCRDWDFACVITGVWPRNQDDTDAARSAVRWVYKVAEDLLSLSSGVYGADLGPDPRDTALATQAFGPNVPRLARLKSNMDPHNVLSYACPLPKTPMEPKLIILVTGESGAGKDYCADGWLSIFTNTHYNLTARTASISDATKREYAAATGADLDRLLSDRAYKEQHRPALTAFFQEQVQQRSELPKEHFLEVVRHAVGVDVLLITGMRDDAPVALFSHLVPDSRLVEVHIQASEETRQTRRGFTRSGINGDNRESNNSTSNLTALDYRPSLIFVNDTDGDEKAKSFARETLLPFFHEDLQRLATIVRHVPDFPRPGIEFRHVLGISEHPGGLTLCTSLLQTHFAGDWTQTTAVACCEAGGFIFASALALQVGVPLMPIREAGKLPPPTVSVIKSPSHISSVAPNNLKEKWIEMERPVCLKDASVVVVDDVLSTGETLCAVLQLLDKAGISAENVSIMVVSEFPVHRGRELLRQRGFGRVNIQSLLVFGGA
jgi:adenine phosphoribosyltransferase/phosphomevalonate kinase